MRDILSSVSKLSIPTILNLFASVIRNKIIAIVIGPTGLGIVSQFVNIFTLTYSIFPIGSLGLVRYISSFHNEGKINELSYYIWYFFKRNLFFTIIASLLIFFLKDQISFLLFNSLEFSDNLSIFCVFIPLVLIPNMIDIYLKGIRKFNVYVLFLSINSIASILFSVIFILFYGVTGAIYSLFVIVIFNAGIGFLILKKNHLLPKRKVKIVHDKIVIKNIYFLGGAVLFSMVIQNITFLAIKSIIASKLGMDKVGIFQSVYSISTSYFGIFFTLIGSYSVPKLSTLKNSKEICHELNLTMKLLLMIYIPVLVLSFSYRSYIIMILYSNTFYQSKDLLIYQLPAELFRALSWVMGLWLIPLLKTKQWVIFELLFYVILFSFFYFLLHMYGVISISIAYLISYVIFFLLNYFYSFKIIKFKLQPDNFKLIFISFLTIIVSYAISFTYEGLGLVISPFFILLWSFLLIRKGDFVKLKEIISSSKLV